MCTGEDVDPVTMEFNALSGWEEKRLALQAFPSNTHSAERMEVVDGEKVLTFYGQYGMKQRFWD